MPSGETGFDAAATTQSWPLPHVVANGGKLPWVSLTTRDRGTLASVRLAITGCLASRHFSRRTSKCNDAKLDGSWQHQASAQSPSRGRPAERPAAIPIPARNHQRLPAFVNAASFDGSQTHHGGGTGATQASGSRGVWTVVVVCPVAAVACIMASASWRCLEWDGGLTLDPNVTTSS